MTKINNEIQTISFEEYQGKVLDIYSYTSKIFHERGIKMIAHSGTLLGIIRHNNGFIPWDDDLDVIVSYKDLNDNYDEIKELINDKDDKYHIFNFVRGEEGIRANLNILRVYSREKYFVKSKWGNGEARPFIDIMVMAPYSTFKSERRWRRYGMHHQMMWITRRGFMRYQRDFHNKSKAFRKNLITYPLKILFPTKRVDRKISVPLTQESKDWNGILRRVDPWTRRGVNVDMSKLQETNICGEKIYINLDYENELIKTFGLNWRKEIESKPHYLSSLSQNHERNIQIEDFLSKISI